MHIRLLWSCTIRDCKGNAPKGSDFAVQQECNNVMSPIEYPMQLSHAILPSTHGALNTQQHQVQPLHKNRSNGLGLGVGFRVRVSGLWFIPPFYREPLQIWHKHASFPKTATLLKFNRLFSENRYTFNLVAPPMLMLPWHQHRLPLGLFICCKWSSP